jgi:hypothetical protein
MAASLFKWLALYVFLFSYDLPNTRPVKNLSLRHPLYVTVTEISHNAKDKALELSCKIFTNDFETALEKTIHTKIDLSAPKDKKAADKAVSDYIVRHLQLKVDGKAVVLQFVGSEKETDATWTYFQVSNIASVKKLDIVNSLLYESFSEEINIMHVEAGGEKKSSKLNSPDTNAVFEF